MACIASITTRKGLRRSQVRVILGRCIPSGNMAVIIPEVPLITTLDGNHFGWVPDGEPEAADWAYHGDGMVADHRYYWYGNTNGDGVNNPRRTEDWYYTTGEFSRAP